MTLRTFRPLAALLLAALLAPAQAQWASVGDVVASGDTLTLTTAYAAPGDPDAPFNLSGTGAADIALVEAAAGVAPYALDLAEPAVEGALASRSFSVVAGQVLRFDWAFTTLESDFEDHAFAVLDGQVLTLATRSAPGAVTQTFSRLIGQAGTLTLAFGVVDTVDVLGVSTLAVSNLQISPVPEPAAALLLLAGLGVVAARSARARRP